jgi:hypothetical protein
MTIEGIFAVARKLTNCTKLSAFSGSNPDEGGFICLKALIHGLSSSSTDPLLPNLTELDFGEVEECDMLPLASTDDHDSESSHPDFPKALALFREFLSKLPTSLKSVKCSADVAARLPVLPGLTSLELTRNDLLTHNTLAELSGCTSLRSLTTLDQDCIPRDGKYTLKMRVDLASLPLLEAVDFVLVNPRLKPNASKNYVSKICDILKTRPLLQNISIAHADCVPSMPVKQSEFLESYVQTVAAQDSVEIQRILLEGLIHDSRTRYPARVPALAAIAVFSTEAAVDAVLKLPSYDPTLLLLRLRPKVMCPLSYMYAESIEKNYAEKFLATLDAASVARAASHPRLDTRMFDELLRAGHVEPITKLMALGLPLKPFDQEREVLRQVFSAIECSYNEETLTKLRCFARTSNTFTYVHLHVKYYFDTVFIFPLAMMIQATSLSINTSTSLFFASYQ